MKKSIYIFIALLLSVNFWKVSFIVRFLNDDLILILTLAWSLCAFIFYNNKPFLSQLFSYRYLKYLYLILLGVFISMFSANLFWGQSFITTLIAQRFIYSFIFLFAIFYVQPTEYDIICGLKWISILTIVFTFLNILYPQLFFDEGRVEVLIFKKNYYYNIEILKSFRLVLVYLYYKIYQYTLHFKWNDFISAMIIILFFILYQNRSYLIGILPFVVFSIFRFRSKYKPLYFIAMALTVGFVVYLSQPIWSILLEETQGQLNNYDYNRWKSLSFYLFEYSPNAFCYLFGNGILSLRFDPGNIINNLRSNGIFSSDIGMIGMWTDYGLLPIIAIYSIIIKILTSKQQPLYLKFISFHILLVPTIFHFWMNPGIMFFILFIYLFAINKEQLHIIKI